MNDRHKWTCENCGCENDPGLDVCSDCGWDKFTGDEDYIDSFWGCDPSEGQYVGDT